MRFAARAKRAQALLCGGAIAAGLLVLTSFSPPGEGDSADPSGAFSRSQAARAAAGVGGAIQNGQQVVLEPGKPILRELAGGEAASWWLALTAGQFIDVVVDQRGIDVVVAIHGPGGERLVEVDSPNDTVGPEPLALAADTPGDYRLEVRSPEKSARKGLVEIAIQELREATKDDRTRAAAQRAMMEAKALRNQRTADSQRAAVARYQQALSQWRTTGDRRRQAYALHEMGLIYGDISEYQQALDSYSQALSLYRALGDEHGRAGVVGNIGWVYGTLGEHQKSIDFYEQARQASRAAGDSSGEPRFLSNIGASYAGLGDYRKALEIHLQVLSLRRAAEDRGGQAITLNNIANCYERLGDKRRALEYYSLALALMPELGNVFYTATTLNHVGVLYRDLGDPANALDRFHQALQFRRTIGDRNGEAATLYEVARLERDRGNLGEARDRIEAALSAVESLRGKLAIQRLRASFVATVRQYHEFRIDLLMRLHKESPSAGFDARALQASEMARARSLLELLAEARTGIPQAADAELFERMSALRERISEQADRQMRLLSGSHGKEQAAAAAKEIDALTLEYEQMEARIRQTSPRYAALTEPVPLTLKEIQSAVLDEETLLLEYALGEEKSYLWAVTPTSIDSYELPGRGEVETTARRVYDLVTARNQSVANETPADRRRRLERADAEFPRASKALSRMLLGPAAEQLGTRRLLIVAEGVLQYTPFAALPGPAAGDSRALVLDHEILTLPSSSVLSVLRRESSSRGLPSRTLMVLADPVFSPDDPRVMSPGGNRRAAAEAKASVTEARRSALESGLADLVRLRFSRQEADEIARLADDGARLLALDFAASRRLATSSEVGDYRIVHFATHALINNRHPELSGVVLSLVDERGSPQNGFLRLYDIYNLRLAADLVVLSACQTALGKEVRGEGLIGLTRGFMYAGAPRVVASLWQIDDRATAELMKRFYQGMLGRGLRPAAALRAAQVSMWQEKRWRPAHYWAAFAFQGEWK